MNTTKILLNNNWRFHLEQTDSQEYAGAWYKGYDDSGEDWQDVTLPHDWSVSLPFSREYSSGTGYLAGGYGWYRLHFHIPEELRGKKLTLCFDGVYKNSQVWCNTYHLGKHPYGYTPFYYDITDMACFGEEENVVCVKVSHPDLADSRWFTGSGIYRKVTLMAEELVHPVRDGIFFTTEEISGDSLGCCESSQCPEGSASLCATVRIDHELINETEEEVSVTILTHLVDAKGNIALELTAQTELSPGGTGKQSSGSALLSLTGTVENPRLWSVEHPHLYRLQVNLSVNGQEFSRVYDEAVGIRTFCFDPDKGFSLNGESMKIKGICMHHDGGCLGAAMTKETWKRRLVQLKEMGGNAIRTSHNPHMPEFYELCDELGFLVMDEAFDEWENPKNKWSTGHNVYPPKHQGYAEDFPEWHERDLESFILRDRNHPCVVLWSIGNELDYPNDPYVHPLFQEMTGNNDANKPAAERIYNPNKPNMERLAPIARELAGIVRRYDTTRPITLAASFPELSSRLNVFDPLDVICYNYKEHLYEEDHLRFPDMPILGSENWHNLDAWKAVTDHDFISGLFVWTGADYLGEALGWPYRAYLTGYLNMAGFPKYYYHWGKSFWSKKPFAALYTCPYTGENEETTLVKPVWNYTPGEQILVRCYTNLPRAELFLNGRSLGICEGWNTLGTMDWIVEYEPGDLSVQAYSVDEDGPEIPGDTAVPAARGRESALLRTPDATTQILLHRWMDLDTAAGIDSCSWGASAAESHGTIAAHEADHCAAGADHAADHCVAAADHAADHYVAAADHVADHCAASAQNGFISAVGYIEQIEITLTDSVGNPALHEALPVTVTVSGDGVLLGLENGDQTDVTSYTEHTRCTTDGRLIAFVRRTGTGEICVKACCDVIGADKELILAGV